MLEDILKLLDKGGSKVAESFKVLLEEPSTTAGDDSGPSATPSTVVVGEGSSKAILAKEKKKRQPRKKKEATTDEETEAAQTVVKLKPKRQPKKKEGQATVTKPKPKPQPKKRKAQDTADGVETAKVKKSRKMVTKLKKASGEMPSIRSKKLIANEAGVERVVLSDIPDRVEEKHEALEVETDALVKEQGDEVPSRGKGDGDDVVPSISESDGEKEMQLREKFEQMEKVLMADIDSQERVNAPSVSKEIEPSLVDAGRRIDPLAEILMADGGVVADKTEPQTARKYLQDHAMADGGTMSGDQESLERVSPLRELAILGRSAAKV
ncbi:hypothetical protein Dimus_005596 [Dionaea muscipula]